MTKLGWTPWHKVVKILRTSSPARREKTLLRPGHFGQAHRDLGKGFSDAVVQVDGLDIGSLKPGRTER